MKALKNSIFALLVLALLLPTGCARHSLSEVYYLIAADLSLPYWQTTVAGFDKAAAQYGVTAKVDGPNGHDPQAELAALHQAITAKPAGILISVADATLLQPEIDAAINAGIPVITIDSDAPASRRLYFIGTNNLAAGKLGAQHLAQKLDGKGNVVFFYYASQANMQDRLEGFKDVFAAYPGIHILDTVDIKGDPNKAFDWTQESLALTGDKKVNAYISLDSSSSHAVADVLQRAGLKDRLILSWDVDAKTLADIKSGLIDSTIAQKPYTMGYYGLKALDEVFHYPPKNLAKDYSVDVFAPYPVFVDTGTALVDQDNVDLYIESAALQAK